MNPSHSPFPCDSVARAESNAAPDTAANPADPCPALLSALEASLRDTQKSLLTRDLPGLERATHAQVRLQQAWAQLLSDRRIRDVERTPELEAFAQRVLQLGRVQLVLLRRSQQLLRTIANLQAGVQGDYSLMALATGPAAQTARGRAVGAGARAREREREALPCRA